MMHLVSLRQAAGVEAHFAAFVRHARSSAPQFTHGWLNAAGQPHPFIASQLAGQLSCTVAAKRRWGIRLPARPQALRTWHCRRELAAANADVLVIWNRTAKAGFALDAMGAERCIHWEHGAAWDVGRESERQRHLDRVPLVIANSTAAARVLQLMWNYRGDVRVCRNALRPSLLPPAPVGKRYPGGRITLGVAARLFPVKGVALALHAVALLAQAHDVSLQVAGAGPEMARLRTLAAALGIDSRVTFHGAVSDMAAFYRDVDCLLHPPITEAFGLVAIEAAAHGCPVVTAAVDGLPEAVADGVSGACVEPTLPLAAYVELGGALEGLPQRVYDPSRDALVAPRALDPAALARAVEHVFRDARTFESLSLTASTHVLRGADFAAHVRDVLTVIDEFLGRRR
jgi:glycosyltransferase involved in cell wall biosynthesis